MLVDCVHLNLSSHLKIFKCHTGTAMFQNDVSMWACYVYLSCNLMGNMKLGDVIIVFSHHSASTVTKILFWWKPISFPSPLPPPSWTILGCTMLGEKANLCAAASIRHYLWYSVHTHMHIHTYTHAHTLACTHTYITRHTHAFSRLSTQIRKHTHFFPFKKSMSLPPLSTVHNEYPNAFCTSGYIHQDSLLWHHSKLQKQCHKKRKTHHEKYMSIHENIRQYNYGSVLWILHYWARSSWARVLPACLPLETGHVYFPFLTTRGRPRHAASSSCHSVLYTAYPCISLSVCSMCFPAIHYAKTRF